MPVAHGLDIGAEARDGLGADAAQVFRGQYGVVRIREQFGDPRPEIPAYPFDRRRIGHLQADGVVQFGERLVQRGQHRVRAEPGMVQEAEARVAAAVGQQAVLDGGAAGLVAADMDEQAGHCGSSWTVAAV